MNDLKKGQDSHNREELKLLSRQHTNRDELQRFVFPYCTVTSKWRGQGGRRLGEKGAGGVREAGEQGTEIGFPRWREKRGKIMQH